ncbi:MAG: M6 family metalloprotease domain-containing protein [Bacteroidales bacterium]|nr:M6 family metalloprotease domain-containing protein [Bacteroidales bacterium]
METIRKLKMALVLAVATLMFSGNVLAVPAFPHSVTVKQSNGKMLTYFIYGDEHISWVKTLDGYTLLPSENGDFVYAITDANGDMVASDMIASNYEVRSAKEKKFIASLDKDLFYSQQQVEVFQQSRALKEDIIKRSSVKKFTTDKPKLMVILVSYSDVKFDSANAVQFKHQIQDSAYTINGFTGSVRDYFHDQSFGTIDPQFSVFGPVTLPRNRAYYAGNNNANASQMIRDAVSIIDTMYNVDFSQYDNDNDGRVDLVHVIFAGNGANTTGQRSSQIWPHMSQLYPTMNMDNKRISTYACSSETNYSWGGSGRIDGIGAVCHEMGHAFGLPDMYATNYSSSIHPASWDVMAAGSYNNNSKTPPYYSMIERDMIGWGNFLELTEGEHKLYPIADSNKAYKIHLSSNEYLVFEYRNKDKWDASLPGVGMIVWHADTSKFINWEMSNSVNNDPDDRGYYIFCAGRESNLETASTPYPGSTNTKDIHYFKLTNGTELDGHILNIHYDGTPDSTIIFNYTKYQDVRFQTSVTDITTTSLKVEGEIICDKGTVTDRKLQYKKTTQTNYTSVDLTADNVTYVLSNLTANSLYNIRLAATLDGNVYYGAVQTIQTACYDGIISELPWGDGFEDGLNCWTQESVKATWKKSTSAVGGSLQPRSGSYLAELSFTQDYYSTSSSRLISPVFDLSEYESATLSFYYAGYSGISSPLVVYYRTSTTGGWTQLATFNNTNSGNSVSWKTATVEMANIGETYQFSIVAKDNYGYGFAIDGLRLEGVKSSSLADNEGIELLLDVVPNPSVSDVTVILKGFEGRTLITVTDVLGRVVDNIQVEGQNNRFVLNSSAYPEGVYYIKATNGEKTLTEKFIKR